MKALIFEARVVQVETEEFQVAAALQWVDTAGVTPAPQVGWSYDGTSFAPPPGPSLDDAKTAKEAAFVVEGVARIAAQVPDWDSLDAIKTVAGLWVSHIAGNATAAQVKAKDIYLYVRDTVPAKLAAVTAPGELDAIDPKAADPFGDGSFWPA